MTGLTNTHLVLVQQRRQRVHAARDLAEERDEGLAALEEEVVENDLVVDDGQNLPDFFVVATRDLAVREEEKKHIAEQRQTEVLHSQVVLQTVRVRVCDVAVLECETREAFIEEAHLEHHPNDFLYSLLLW